MKIGIIGASEDEIAPVIEHIDNRCVEVVGMMKFYCGKYENFNVVAVYCGSSNINASKGTEILINKFNVSHIIITGVASKINDNLKIGNTVIATEVLGYIRKEKDILRHVSGNDIKSFPCDYQLLDIAKKAVDRNIFSQNIIFGTIESDDLLEFNSGYTRILCEDHESATIAKVCSENLIPFISIQTIINDKNSISNDAYEIKRISASYNSISIINRMLRLCKVY